MKPVRRNRILLVVFTVVLTVAAILAAWALYAYWARPDRLSEAECRALVEKAWVSWQGGAMEGSRILEYDLGGRIHRANSKSPAPEGLSLIADRLRAVFPQRKPDDAFFANIQPRHAGRLIVGGRTGERIRLSPRSYRGDSVEIWVEAGNGHVLGVRRYDPDGRFARGFRYGRSFDRSVIEQVPPPGPAAAGWDVALVPPEEIRQMAQMLHGEVLLPAQLPKGFELVGGRELPAGGGLFGPGGIGLGGREPRMGRAYEGLPPDEMHIQLVFSDGLNTISVFEYRLPRFMELLPRMEVFDAALQQKAQEINRIFHTSMQARMVPGGLIMLYGEVDMDVLKGVADSLPAEGFKEGLPGLLSPEGVPPGLRPPMGGPMGPGFGGPRGRGEMPPSDPE